MRDLARSGFTVVLVVFVFSTMLSAGLSASRQAMAKSLRSRRFRATAGLVLVANVLVIPFVAVVLVRGMEPPTPAAVGLILLASSPGAPFAAKLVLLRHGDVHPGVPLQLLLAVVGTVTFAVSANAALTLADVGTDVQVPVAPLMATVAVLQLVPFGLGMWVGARSPGFTDSWLPALTSTSSSAFVVALVLAIVAAGPEIAALPASVLVVAVAFAIVSAAVGATVAVGGAKTRAVTATLAPMRATGPPLAAVTLVFGNDPGILGAITGEIVVVLSVGVITSLSALSAARERATAVTDGSRAR